MFSIVFTDLTDPQKINNLSETAKGEISIRGYHIDRVKIDSDLKNKSWFLPVNEIISGYCPTDRYTYLKRFVPEAKLQLTWDSFKGRIIDDLYKELYEAFSTYVQGTEIKEFIISEELEKFGKNKLEKIKKKIDKDKNKMIESPEEDEITEFLINIKNLLRLETELCSSIIDHKISIKKDINLKSEVALLFPFIFKVKINAPDLGFTEGAEPDFIYRHMAIGDIKTGEWQDFFYLTCAAYALAYEFEHKKDIDLGVILNPIFHEQRTVPLYYNSELVVIKDKYRKDVLALRDKKINLIKNQKDPKTPANKSECPKGCGYLNYCWGNNNGK